MEDFEKTMEKIKRNFGQREGFTDEVLDAITATYIYLAKNYPQEIDESKIPDVKDFQFAGFDGKRTLANIYINRIAKNVSKVVFADHSVYDPEERSIIVESDVSKRLAIWQSITNGEEQKNEVVSKQIKAKLIVHELIHAASDNGFMTGFTVTFGADEKKHAVRETAPSIYKDENAWSEKLEEAMTEILALNIVGNNLLAVTQSAKDKGFYVCRNADSSNRMINPFAEYFCRIYPDSVEGKFTDGFLWCNNFEENVANKWGVEKVFKSSVRGIETYLSDITSPTPKLKAPTNVISCFQEMMLTDYCSKLDIKTKDEVIDQAKSFVAFKLFAAKQPDGKIEKALSTLLDKVKDEISKKAEALGVSKEELNNIVKAENQRLQSKVGENDVYTIPYSQLKGPKEGVINR